MSSSIFRIQEHFIPTCHIREYPRALATDDQEEECQLAVKQYTPKEGQGLLKNGVTIVGAHANGFPKVLETLRSAVLKYSLTRQSGALRAALGRSLSTIESQRHLYTKYMDC